MTIQELGSLGELVGAVAVLFTLVYLAYQTRQNGELLRQSADAQRASMATANVQNWHNFFSGIAGDSGTALLVGKLRRGEVIEDRDIDRMGAILFMDLLNVENLFFQQKYNPWGDDNWDAALVRFCEFHVDWLLGSSAAQRWWEVNQVAFGTEFAELVSRLLLERSGGVSQQPAR